MASLRKPTPRPTPTPAPRWTRFPAALAMVLTLVACGESPTDPADVGDGGDGGDGGTPGAQADVNAFAASLPAWETFSPPLAESADGELGDPEPGAAPAEIAPGDPRYNPNFVCTSTPYSLKTNPEQVITMQPNLGLLVPGVLIQGASHKSGSLQELPIRERTPVKLTISLNNVIGDAFREVTEPSPATLKTAVNELVQAAETSSFEAGSSVDFQQATSYSFEQAALGMGLSARYMGASVKASLDSETSAEQLTVTASFIQNAFTIGIEAPSSPKDWFSDDFTEARLQDQIDNDAMGPDNLPVYVSDVTYGRIIMISFTSSASEEDIKASLEATYNGGFWGGELSIDGDRQEILKESELSIQQMGGPTSGAFQLAHLLLEQEGESQPGDFGLAEFFEEDVPLTTFVPISYTLRNLAGGSIARVGEAASYDLVECEALTQTLQSDFETDLDGWTASEAVVTHIDDDNEAIVGSGVMKVGENSGGLAHLEAPDKYIGDKLAYLGGILKFWVRWDRVDGAADDGDDLPALEHPHVTVIGANGRVLVYSGALWKKSDFPRNTWITREIALDPHFDLDVGWRTYNPSGGETLADAVPATQGDFDGVFANVVELHLQGEFRANRGDWGFIDHVQMKPPTS